MSPDLDPLTRQQRQSLDRYRASPPADGDGSEPTTRELTVMIIVGVSVVVAVALLAWLWPWWPMLGSEF
jgi:fatty acid desaturase